ncbi:hypothetical protein V202x_21740 [Gimesia aquarii]|uniref:Uncharacterized protein n=2 Tax=Gimesia aquarii TaxID=2527964 RepID=A0A517WU77_9PLAN|nr:hypothetical protein V202x_21740 [Gimesia aquarii]
MYILIARDLFLTDSITFSQLHFVVMSMLHRSHQQSAMQVLLTAVTVCAFTLLTSESANATCGDYLSHAGQQNENPMILLHAPDQRPQSPPCSGPECGNQQSDPQPQTPAITITILKPACSLFSETVPAHTLRSESMYYETLILPESHGRRVDRPPQALAS